MNSLRLLVIAAAVCALAGAAYASPLATVGQQGKLMSETANAGLDSVHYCHSGWQRDQYGWHYHRGRYCNRVSGREYRGPSRPRNCVKVGPIWICP